MKILQVVDGVKVMAVVDPGVAEPLDGDGTWMVVQPADVLAKLLIE